MPDYRDTAGLRKDSRLSLMHGYHNPFSNSDRNDHHQHMSTARYLQQQQLTPSMSVGPSEDYRKKPTHQLSLSNVSQAQSADVANSGDGDVSKRDATNQALSSSSLYVPQVEAISPTPEDQKENTNLQEIKEKICSEISKVDKDIASTNYHLEVLKKRQARPFEFSASIHSFIIIVLLSRSKSRSLAVK
jgi:hypothetical protein